MMRRPRIAVFGSVHMDLIAFAEHLPEKAHSGLAHGFNMGLGGKGGNQAVECAALGAEVFMVTQLGEDDFGKNLLGMLAKRGVDCSAIKLAVGKQTGASTVLSAPEGYTSLIYPGAAADMSEADVASSITKLAPLDMLLLQLELPLRLSLAAANAAKALGASVILNPSPPAKNVDALIALSSLVIMNETEALAIASTTSAKDCAKKLGCDVVITLGAKGCIASDGKQQWSQPAIPVKIEITVGAGDAFLAGLCVALCQGSDMQTALQNATATAARKLTG
jgi:ribokinase